MRLVLMALTWMVMTGGAVAQSTAEQPYRATDTALVNSLQKSYSGNVDTDFLSRMIAQHEAGIERAKQALMYSSDAKVRMMAGDMLKNLNTDLRAMKEWMAQHGTKPAAAAPAPMPKALPATTAAAAAPAALTGADKMRAAATLPRPVSAGTVVTPVIPPTDIISDTMALNDLSPAAGPEKVPDMPQPEQDIENTPPVMEFLDGGV